MATTLKKYNIEGKETGTVEVSEKLATAEARAQMIKDYIVAIRNNARQWSANTKTRAEVKHTTCKVRPQKGTGNARHGSFVTAQFRGGGVVFGPKPKFDQHVRINKKERKAAIRALIGEMIRNDQLCILEEMALEEPKTQRIASFMKALGIEKRVLFIGDEEQVEVDEKKVSVKCSKHDHFMKSMRNIPKAEFRLAKNISGYDVMIAKHIVMTESALKEMTEWLG